MEIMEAVRRFRRRRFSIQASTLFPHVPPMQTEFSLEHIGLAAQDTTALKDWYVRSLGARVVFANGEQPPAYIIELPGGVWVEIYQGNFGVKETSDNKLHGWRHLALCVKSIENARHELQ